jgi:predicted MFS family arabinose efflux permease
MRGYADLLGSRRFVLLALASGVPFNGMFLYVLSAPSFLGELLQLAPTQFFWFFVINIAGIMGGAWASGRLAGRIDPRRQVRWGYAVMVAISLLNVAANALFDAHAAWSMWPIAVYSFGWALLTPVVTLMLLDVVPGAARAGLLAAGGHRQCGQRHRRRPAVAAGDALGAAAFDRLDGPDERRAGGVGGARRAPHRAAALTRHAQ